MGQRSTFWGLILSWAAGAAFAQCDPDKLNISGAFGSANFTVSVVDTDEDRARGLMFVDAMPRFTGMLFVYDAPRSVAFWMKNTLIPLDMIFADETGEVQKIHQNAIPHDLTAISGGEGIQYVLEVNAGVSAMLGLQPGDVMQHPSIKKPARPCE